MKKGRVALLIVLLVAVSLGQFKLLVDKITPVVVVAQENFARVYGRQSLECSVCGQEKVSQAIQPSPFLPERIVVSKVNINLPVVPVVLKDGTWSVNPKVANYAEGTSLVDSRGGNVGIFGHDRSDAFTGIKELQPGDSIIVYGNGQRADYSVSSALVVHPSSVDVFYPTKQPTLTLITCSGVFSEKRYAVKASLVNISKLI